MYIADFNNYFFNVLTGKNTKLIELSIIALYDANYGNNTTYYDDMSKDDVRKTILSAIGNLDWYDEDTDDKIKKDQIKVSNIIKKLKDCGWIEFPTNSFKMTKFFAFTKYGKKFSQLIYLLQDPDVDLTKQKNVRQTKLSLQAYRDENNPEHLIDAFNTSKEVISDLADAINDIKELKNILMQKARQSVNEAGENFLNFFENQFKNDIANKLGDDSVRMHQEDINRIIFDILDEPRQQKEQRIARLNKGLFISFYKKNESLDTILNIIYDRILNACDVKLPTLTKEVQSYITSGGKIFRQTSSLINNDSKKLYAFAKKIKSLESKDEKNKLLRDFSNEITFTKLKMYDTNGVKIKNKTAKNKRECYLEQDSKITLDILINSVYNRKRLEAFSYTEAEQKEYADALFDENKKVILSKELPINKAKEVLLSLFSIDYFAKNSDMFEVEQTDEIDDQFYYKTESFRVRKKQ